MDQIDCKILDFLQKDAKLTAKEMADKLALTPTPVYERIKKMERAGIIKSYVALVDAQKVGRGLMVFLNITIKEHQKKQRSECVQQIQQLPDVVELYHTSGSHDFLAKVRFENVRSYRDFLVNEVSAIANIGDIDSQIVLEEIKVETSVRL